jgi:hypothetical protein
MQHKLFAIVVVLALALSVWDVPAAKAAPEAVCTWTSATSTSWTTATNGSGCGGVAPAATDTVVIPDAATTPRDPVLGANTTILGFTINAGGVFNDGGNNLTVSGTSIVLNGSWLGTGRLYTSNAGTTTIDGTGSMGTGTRLGLTAGSVTFPASPVTSLARCSARWAALTPAASFLRWMSRSS